MFQNLIDIIAAPQSAFTNLNEKPNALLPIILIMLLVGLTQFLYFSNVDPEFLLDQLVEQASSFVSMPENELRTQIAASDPGSKGLTNAISSAVFIPIVIAIYAGYLSLISKFTSDEVNYKRWFSFVSWTTIPVVFSSLAAIVVIMTSSDGMVSLLQLKPFSLNSLLFHTSGPFKTMLSNLDLTQLWSIALLTLGYQNWTGKTLLKSFVLVALPYLLIYGIWTLIIIL